MPLRRTADRAVAREMADSLKIERNAGSLSAHSCGRERGLDSGVPGPDYDYLELHFEIVPLYRKLRLA